MLRPIGINTWPVHEKYCLYLLYSYFILRPKLYHRRKSETQSVNIKQETAQEMTKLALCCHPCCHHSLFHALYGFTYRLCPPVPFGIQMNFITPLT